MRYKNLLTGKGGNEEQVPSTESAFPHWMAADRHCLKYAVALELPDCQVILFPRSFTKDSVRGHMLVMLFLIEE